MKSVLVEHYSAAMQKARLIVQPGFFLFYSCFRDRLLLQLAPRGYTAGTDIALGDVLLNRHLRILIVLMTARLGERIEFEGHDAPIAAAIQARSNAIPIGDAVERQKMQVVDKGNPALRIADAEVVVDMRCDQAVAIETSRSCE